MAMNQEHYRSMVFGDLAVARVRIFGVLQLEITGVLGNLNAFRDVPLHIAGAADVPVARTVASAETVHAAFLSREAELRRAGLRAILDSDYTDAEDKALSVDALFNGLKRIAVLSYFVPSGEVSVYYETAMRLGSFAEHNMNIVTDFNLVIQNVILDG